MSDNLWFIIVLCLCLSTCGKPDLIDGVVYKLTGVKTWEQCK